MSLLHKPKYTYNYSKEDDKEGLSRLLWSQFMCKCGVCQTNSGKNYMERLPVFILDDIAKDDRMRFDVELAYVCKRHGDKLPLPSKDSHRVGLGVRLRVLDKKKRMKVIRGLIIRGVTRIKVSDKSLYYDTDDLKSMIFVIE